jgi:hypothetical protein
VDVWIWGIKLAIKNHISLSVNRYWIKIYSDLEIKSGNWSYGLMYPKSQPPKSQCQKTRSSVATLMKSKWDEVATIILCKIKLKKCIFYLILSIGVPLYQEGCYIDCQQSFMLNKSPNTQVRWVKHNGHTHSTSHWTRENWMVRFPKPEGPVWADELQLLVSKYRMFRFPKPDVLVFTS